MKSKLVDKLESLKVAFLDESNSKTFLEEKKSGVCTRKKCCLVCLGSAVSSLIVSLCLVIILRSLPDKTKYAADWEARLKNNQNYTKENSFTIDGNYSLVSYDDQYDEYLKAVGVPWIALPIILAASENLEVNWLEDGADIETVTGWMTTKMKYKFNTTFSIEYGQGMGILWNICNLDGWNVINCRSEEREKGWNLGTTQTFSPEGMVEERHFLGKNIRAKKYFKKLSESAAVTTGHSDITTTTTESSWSESDDKFFMLKGWEDWR